MHIQSLPRSRDTATIAENWSLTERRFRHLERTVLGRYLLSCHTVICVITSYQDVSVPSGGVSGADSIDSYVTSNSSGDMQGCIPLLISYNVMPIHNSRTEGSSLIFCRRNLSIHIHGRKLLFIIPNFFEICTKVKTWQNAITRPGYGLSSYRREVFIGTDNDLHCCPISA